MVKKYTKREIYDMRQRISSDKHNRGEITKKLRLYRQLGNYGPDYEADMATRDAYNSEIKRLTRKLKRIEGEKAKG